MGLIDDIVPGGNIAKPLMLALGSLLVGKMMDGGGQEGSSTASTSSGTAPGAADASAAGQADGTLGGLLDKLAAAGHGETANSWLGAGPNKPIDPGHLGNALGQQTVTNLAQQAGVNEQDLLHQLAQVLPGVIDRLTPNGQLPTVQQIASLFKS